VAALVPKGELDGEMGDAHMAMQARLMSQALRKLCHSLSLSQCILIFINQVARVTDCTVIKFSRG
jgi:recombination protein RecA